MVHPWISYSIYSIGINHSACRMLWALLHGPLLLTINARVHISERLFIELHTATPTIKEVDLGYVTTALH